MKYYISFHDRYGEHICPGSDGAYFSNLKSRNGLLNESKRFKKVNPLRDRIVSARVFTNFGGGHTGTSPIYVFYI